MMKYRTHIHYLYYGFTLVEVMLALALTAMLLGLLSTGVFIVAEDWNRNSDVLDETLDEALAVLQIDRALHGAFPHSYIDRENLSREIYFSGERDFLSWVSTVSPQRSAGLTAWQLFAVDNEGVYLTLVPAFSDNPGSRLQESESQLIFPGYDIEFNYLYEELDEDLEWIDEWDGKERLSLPLAVYVHLVPFDTRDSNKESKEIVARIRNNIHRSIRPNLLNQAGL